MTDPAKPSEQQETNPETPAKTEAEQYSAILSSITREDGTQKFDNVDTALQSIAPKDDHIKSIEAENATLKEELLKRTAQEDILKQFMEKRPSQEGAEPAPASVDQETLNNIVTSLFDQREASQVEQSNREQVTRALFNTYGDKAPEVLDAKAKEMGISSNFLKEIIAKSPEAGIELLGISKKSNDGTPAKIEGSQNTEGFNEAPATAPKSVLGNMFSTEAETMDCWNACHPEKYTG